MCVIMLRIVSNNKHSQTSLPVGNGALVSDLRRMRKSLGSNPNVSIFCGTLSVSSANAACEKLDKTRAIMLEEIMRCLVGNVMRFPRVKTN